MARARRFATIFLSVLVLSLLLAANGQDYDVVEAFLQGVQTLVDTGFISELSLSQGCESDVIQFVNDSKSGEDYAKRMITSFANVPSLEGLAYTERLEYFGVYEQCVAIVADEATIPFDAQYCIMHLPVETEVYLSLGSCLPESCSTEELNIIGNTAFIVIGAPNPYLFFLCDLKVPWNGGAIFVLCMLSFFAVLVIVGTVYHVYANAQKKENGAAHKTLHQATYQVNQDAERNKQGGNDEIELRAASNGMQDNSQSVVIQDGNTNEKKEGMLGKILQSFSVVKNFKSVTSAKKTPAMLTALNGIRVLSLLWIIWYHTNTFNWNGKTDNPAYIRNSLATKFSYRLVLDGTYGVDSFFMLSGLLVTYLTLKSMKKSEGKKNWLLFCIHRFLRLTPTYMVCLAIWATFTTHLAGRAIGWQLDGFTYTQEQCRKYWWTHLLYINNLVPYPGNVNAGCMGWTWYLANDMQFFALTPFILYLLYQPSKSKYGFGVIGILATISFSSLIGLNTYYGNTISDQEPYNNHPRIPGGDYIYGKPWCRINAYLIGIIFGYVLCKLPDRKLYIKKWLNILCWVLTLCMLFVLVFGLHWIGRKPLPQWFAVLWLSLHRTLFALGVGWIAFACCTGNGGPVNAFLSWKLWIPLGHLSYGTYLLHPMLIIVFKLNLKTAIHITPYVTSYLFLGNVIFSYAASLVIALLVEIPTLGLEKILLPRA